MTSVSIGTRPVPNASLHVPSPVIIPPIILSSSSSSSPSSSSSSSHLSIRQQPRINLPTMRRQERVGVWAYTPVAPIIVARKHDFPQCLGWYALQIIYPVIWIIGLAVLPILLCLAYVQSHISRRLWFKRLVRRWRLRKSNKSFLRHIVQPVQTSLQIRGKADTERSPSPPTDLFFGKLPPEIRRSILIYAFGDRVVHLHIEYFRPSEAVRRRQAGQGMMRRAITKAAFASHTRHWRWHSRLCTSMPGSDFRESRSPDWMRDDPCLGPTLFGGSSYIVHVGVTGWLLTCRQAYVPPGPH
ncbi:hypothetical protein B0I35DRAFT_426930 [Stachybotrys elegans]|uniref:Uncharacterized protein n=1 Tax=Stachybotrys elegans TaxID=80388 RepID=A0A8K0WUB9_9HYPO|nr:hypothetical protein B0I35DRAFT_426930 [Stachybotrys elegans]